MTQYQVVGECAHVTTTTPRGPERVLLYRPAVLPADVPEHEIQHLLARKLIAPLGAPASAPAQAPADTTEDAAGEAGEDPAAPPAPSTGGRPQQADPKARWVDYAVTQGMDRDEATKASKADLIAALKD